MMVIYNGVTLLPFKQRAVLINRLFNGATAFVFTCIKGKLVIRTTHGLIIAKMLKYHTRLFILSYIVLKELLLVKYVFFVKSAEGK